MILEYEYVDLLFENCNCVRIYPEDIMFLGLGELTEDLWINMSGQYSIVKRCKSAEIILKNKALENKTRFEIDHPRFDDNLSSFKNHLDTYKDITRIIIRKDGMDLDVSVPYKDENGTGSPNSYQKVDYISKTFKDSFDITIRE